MSTDDEKQRALRRAELEDGFDVAAGLPDDEKQRLTREMRDRVQETRIERLTELARRVWPGFGDELYTSAYGVVTGFGDVLISVTRHPRALDALEAALLVLAGEPPFSHEREWKAVEAQVRDAELRARAKNHGG